MKLYNTYIITVASLLFLVTVILAALRQGSLQVYCAVYFLVTIIASELYVYFNARARRGLTVVNYVMLAAFLAIIILQAISIFV